jgi:hypothetical protein
MVIKKKTLNLGYWKIIVVKEINSRVVLLDDIGKCLFLFLLYCRYTKSQR